MSRRTLLVVEDDPGLQEAIVDTLQLSDYHCLTANCGEAALVVLQRQKVDMIISDVQMPGMDGLSLLQNVQSLYPQIPMLLMTAFGNIEGAVRAMRDGAVDYLVKPFAPEVLLNQVSRYVPAQIVERRIPIYGDPKTAELLQLAVKVARSDASVMISGPSGAGKEVLARYIHDQSARAEQPFVAINCAAIPENMLEATLFGYEKGAFTGAVQGCPGKFEQAQGGTLLLDEITEMDPALQAKLLRVLQEREVERLGSRKTISLDVRVIATTNRDLRKAVTEHQFREDLFYRLNVFPLRWLPLCSRVGDILPLAEHLLRRHALEQKLAVPELTTAASHKLLSYSWPGNVRELENVMQRALILAKDQQITADEILFDTEAVYAIDDDLGWDDEPDDAFNDRVPGIEKLGNELRQQEHQIILDTLIACEGSRKAVAERLGISPRTLRYKLARMRDVGIDVPD
ncbi:sigma-54-dependent transcriptional regulator [Tolumonas lignilytica]|uniref:sigma-54-dependent transcriptional regulator n=1 Tax=Tolumonas lignilytica TaxID=1283284 RepID=UPI000467DE14|nr:sigma-54 dependent transcriptional regulator [Tolumonas lignilytica]